MNAAGIQAHASRSEETPSSVIDENNSFVLGTSTWEHGRINPKFDTLLEFIRTHSMAGKKAAFVGLGDTRYEPVSFNAGMTLLRETFLQSGGTELTRPLIIDGDPFPLLDTKVPYWTEAFISQVRNEK